MVKGVQYNINEIIYANQYFIVTYKALLLFENGYAW